MTTKRYPESRDLSRPRRKSTRPPSATPRNRSRPFGRHFEKLDTPASSGEEHPINAMVDRIPKVRALQRRFLGQAKRVQALCSDQGAFIALQDLRLEFAIMRERLFFDAGHHLGLVVGRAESHAASASNDQLVRSFTHQVGLVAASGSLPPERLAAALLQVTRSVVLGLPMH